ncbi:putative MDR permease possible transmembrane efflux protein [Lactococcus cremoris]|uniref:Putative MDR permease possible transmembrane efflux protein n=1 Tax=Lactococcus lactis subsp. cremoris TaxID=1359 RepID=A0A161VZE5_LACLC|nr:MFS transporter [Lactococcus cremoris]KZK04739.1 putative MDR permease possible transmembrane efflux protein [Lactococcus cremoris]
MYKKIFILMASCIGIFLCMLDTTVMNIALPAIQSGLHTNLSALSWAINAYTIIFAAFTIPLSKVAERLGMNKFYILGLFFFLIGSILSANSGDLSSLIIGRIIQSLGAATIFPLSMVIGINTMSLDKRTKVIAALGVTQGLAAALGPTIGGVLTQYFSWRWIFLINVPLISLSIILCLIFLQFREEKKEIKIDILGAVLSIIVLFSMTLALVQGREWGWASPIILLLMFTSIIGLFGFIFYERSIDFPMIPMRLFQSRQFNGAALTIILSNLFLVGVTVVLPTYFTKIQNKSELTAALLVTPISAMIFIFSPIAALLINKIGSRIIIAVGFFSMAVAYILFSTISMTSLPEVISACIFLGFGYGIIAGPILVLAAADFTGEMLTASQSVVGVLRQVGIVLAVAIFVTGLYNNISVAKKDAINEAQNQITKLSLPTKQKNMMLKQVEQKIESENSTSHFSNNHVTPQEKQKLITEKYTKIIQNMSNKTEESESEVLQQVTSEVNNKIDHINMEINGTIEKITIQTKKQFSIAFVKLYRSSIIFILLSMLVSMLFIKKKSI